LRRTFALFCALACALGVLVLIAGSFDSVADTIGLARTSTPANPDGTVGGFAARHSPTILGDLAGRYAECIRVSRPVLLGSRDPSGRSCLPVVKNGELGTAAPRI